jgi:phage protein U
MTTLLWLGSIKLDALTVRDMPTSRSWEWAEHKTIAGLPVLQQTGRASDGYTLNIRIHPQLGTPASILGELYAAGDRGEVLILQTGAGEQLGSYVLTSVDVNRTSTTPKGEIIVADVSLKLKEHRPVDFEVVQGIAIEGNATNATATPTPIDESRDPADVPPSEMVRA